MKETLKNKLKSQYGSLSELPSDDLWNRMEVHLELQNNSKKKSALPIRKKAIVLKAAAVLLFSAGLVVILKMSRIQEYPQKVVAKKIPEIATKHQTVSANKIDPKTENMEVKKISATESLAVSAKEDKHYMSSQKIKADEKILSEVMKPESSRGKLDSARNERVAQQPSNREPAKYVTAQDLLFEREAGRTLKEQQRSQTSKLGSITGIKIDKPKEVRILGITVYSAGEEP